MKKPKDRQFKPGSIAWAADVTPAANQPESQAHIQLIDLLAAGPRELTVITPDGRIAIPKRPRSMAPTKYLDFWREPIMIITYEYESYAARVRYPGPEQAMLDLAKLLRSGKVESHTIEWEQS